MVFLKERESSLILQAMSTMESSQRARLVDRESWIMLMETSTLEAGSLVKGMDRAFLSKS